MAEHTASGMNTAQNERTFAAFVTFTKRATVVIVVVLVFLALVNG